MATNATFTRPSLTTNLVDRYNASDDANVPQAVTISSPFAKGFILNTVQGQTNFNLNATSMYAPGSAQLQVYDQSDVQ